MQGKIVKGIAGFYYVHSEGQGIFECRAKGIFRKDKTKPLVGDDVEMQILDREERTGSITALLPRKNELPRPAVANVDQALVIFSVTKPAPSLNLLDRFLVMMRQRKLPCVICFNKQDIAKAEELQSVAEAYEKCGSKVLFVSALRGDGLEELADCLRSKTTTVAGPSGVGKSSLVNRLTGGSVMETGSISEKIERGKHTTRHSELLSIGENTYIMDTPGFSSLALFSMEKEELASCYAEFAPYEENCRFRGCSHVSEPECGIKEALAKGLISQSRYRNYTLLYEELKAKKRW